MEQTSCALTAGEVEMSSVPSQHQLLQSLWHEITAPCLWVDKQGSLQTSSYTSCSWFNSGECLCLQEQQCGVNLKVGLFPHKSLSFAMNSVFTCAIAAAHTLRLSLSCALWISTVATQAAGKGSCLRQRLLTISLSKLKPKRTLVDISRQENLQSEGTC